MTSARVELHAALSCHELRPLLLLLFLAGGDPASAAHTELTGQAQGDQPEQVDVLHVSRAGCMHCWSLAATTIVPWPVVGSENSGH